MAQISTRSRRHRLIPALWLLLALAPASLCGCSDDDPVQITGNTLEVTSPAAGVNLLEQTTTDIAWTTTGEPGPLTITLLNDGLAVGVIAAFHDQGSPYTWTVAAQGAQGGDNFSIVVASAAVPDVADESGLFTLTIATSSIPLTNGR